MASLPVFPAPASVRCDADGRPREIRIGGERLSVTMLESLRDEMAAYPPATGPRAMYVLRAGAWRLRLTFRGRDGRWLVESLDPRSGSLGAAA